MNANLSIQNGFFYKRGTRKERKKYFKNSRLQHNNQYLDEYKMIYAPFDQKTYQQHLCKKQMKGKVLSALHSKYHSKN